MSAGPVVQRLGLWSRASYTAASIHEGVRVTDLVRALASHGMTMSNVAGQGVVIHRIGQDPNRPAPFPPDAS